MSGGPTPVTSIPTHINLEPSPTSRLPMAPQSGNSGVGIAAGVCALLVLVGIAIILGLVIHIRNIRRRKKNGGDTHTTINATNATGVDNLALDSGNSNIPTLNNESYANNAITRPNPAYGCASTSCGTASIHMTTTLLTSILLTVVRMR